MEPHTFISLLEKNAKTAIDSVINNLSLIPILLLRSKHDIDLQAHVSLFEDLHHVIETLKEVRDGVGYWEDGFYG